MESYTLEQVLDALYRYDYLQETSLEELCQLSGRPYGIRQKYFRVNMISEIIAIEYGNDMLVQLIVQMGIKDKLVHLYPAERGNNGWAMAVCVPDNPNQQTMSYYWHFEKVFARVGSLDPKKYKIL